MGCGKSTANVGQVANPVPSTSTATHDRMSHRLMPYLSIDSPLNINHKYAVFFPIISTALLSIHFAFNFSFQQRIKKWALALSRLMLTNRQSLSKSYSGKDKNIGVYRYLDAL